MYATKQHVYTKKKMGNVKNKKRHPSKQRIEGVSKRRRTHLQQAGLASGLARSLLMQSILENMEEARKQIGMHGDGFYIFKGALHKALAISNDSLSRLCPDKVFNWRKIRNDFHEIGRPSSRYQLAYKDCDDEVKFIINLFLHYVAVFIQDEDHLNHDLAKVTQLLKSTGDEFERQQDLHFDAFQRNRTFEQLLRQKAFENAYWTENRLPPMSMICALHDTVKLNIIRRSHRAVRGLELLRKVEELILEPGELICFRGDVLHSGSVYCRPNVRLHVFIDYKLAGIRHENGITLVDPADVSVLTNATGNNG
jgi:hypothetical protein